MRIVFCLFADDTGIFEPRDIFLDLLESRTREDGSDLGGWLAQLFQALNTPEDGRQKNLDSDLDRFPYINGDLFRDTLVIPSFDAKMRQRLIDACLFDWSAISPAIFGSLFQSVMNPVERRRQGAHYTTEKNILKVIGPLFLDDLRAEFARLKARRDSRRLPELLKFQEKLGGLRLLDPACGCGNFLIISYRELRALEIEALRETKPGGQLDAWADAMSLINVDQFYGIEIGEFPARIAETALWMMDHIMNNRLSLEFGRTYVRIPLNKSPHILNADALELDWAELLPPENCSYVLGNPPFIGQSMQSSVQRAQMAKVIDAENGRAGSLDYVGAWFIKAGRYVQNSPARIGFVATNSITQGEQVAQLWPILFDRCHLELAFAHRTFAWGSDARGKAHVHVVILGLAKASDAPKDKRLFAYDDINGEPHESLHAALTPYLFDGGGLANPHLVVKEAREPLDALPIMRMGSKLVEGGHYIFDAEEKEKFLVDAPGAAKFLVPLIGSQEFIQGNKRWILALQKASVMELKAMPAVTKRIQAVREYRARSKKAATRSLADTPVEFEVTTIPTTPFLVVPETSSERREYIPIGWMEPPVIPSNAVRIIENATLPLFGLLTSAMHMSWLRHIGGRLKSCYRYSIGIVYNTFPMPPVSHAELEKLAPLAQAVLDARAAHQATPSGSAPASPGATLADLYDPDLMPANLRKAHQALDSKVDRLYAPKGFTSDFERVAHLFGLYEKMTAPLVLAAAAKPKIRRRKSSNNLLK